MQWEAGVRRGVNQQVAAGRAGRITNDQIIGGVKHDTNTIGEVNAGNYLRRRAGRSEWMGKDIDLVAVGRRKQIARAVKGQIIDKGCGTVLECRRWGSGAGYRCVEDRDVAARGP